LVTKPISPLLEKAIPVAVVNTPGSPLMLAILTCPEADTAKDVSVSTAKKRPFNLYIIPQSNVPPRIRAFTMTPAI
jgi:hypothetical protein